MFDFIPLTLDILDGLLMADPVQHGVPAQCSQDSTELEILKTILVNMSDYGYGYSPCTL